MARHRISLMTVAPSSRRGQAAGPLSMSLKPETSGDPARAGGDMLQGGPALGEHRGAAPNSASPVARSSGRTCTPRRQLPTRGARSYRTRPTRRATEHAPGHQHHRSKMLVGSHRRLTVQRSPEKSISRRHGGRRMLTCVSGSDGRFQGGQWPGVGVDGGEAARCLRAWIAAWRRARLVTF